MNYQSAPVDLEHPSFGSLLSALKEVHEGRLPAEALLTYQSALAAELRDSRAAVTAVTGPEEVREALEEQQKMTCTALDISQIAVDALGEYVASPSPETMAQCVRTFLQAQEVMGQLHVYLDGLAAG